MSYLKLWTNTKMILRTTIKPPNYSFRIGYKSKILSLGSCFSEEIASKLGHLKYDVLQNPCGITFNPASILSTIKRVEVPDSLHSDQLIFSQSLYVHQDFHGSFNDIDPNNYLERAKSSLLAAQDHAEEVDVVFITLGTTFVYKRIDSGQIVNNCHKLPAAQFQKELLDLTTVSDLLKEIRERLVSLSSRNINFIWTVSPVRHTKNGIVDDRKSKSIALLAVHDLVEAHDDCHYFPSYELMTDDLRDYRFYKEDLIHPTKQAVQYIFETFERCLLKEDEKELRQKIQSLVRRQQHRPLFPESEEHKKLLESITRDQKALIDTYPYLNDRWT